MGTMQQEVSWNQGAAHKISLTEGMIDCKQRRKKLHRVAFLGTVFFSVLFKSKTKPVGIQDTNLKEMKMISTLP